MRNLIGFLSEMKTINFIFDLFDCIWKKSKNNFIKGHSDIKNFNRAAERHENSGCHKNSVLKHFELMKNLLSAKKIFGHHMGTNEAFKKRKNNPKCFLMQQFS